MLRRQVSRELTEIKNGEEEEGDKEIEMLKSENERLKQELEEFKNKSSELENKIEEFKAEKDVMTMDLTNLRKLQVIKIT